MRAGPSSERAVILAPRGRDASVAAALIREAGYHAQICSDLAALTREIEGGAGLAVIADEAIKNADLRGLVHWLNGQPSWSDFPIVLLTHQGGGPERNPDAARLGQALGNVTFLERPFHPTTLVSIVGSAVRGRRRQYEARAILRRSDRKRTPAADRAERRPSRRAGTASAGLTSLKPPIPASAFRTEAGRAVLVSGFAGGGSSRRPGAAPEGARAGYRDRRGLQHRIPRHLA